MSGARLGRGRGGRLALYGGCGAVIIFLVFLYRAATSEMAKLRELHLKCVQQQEAFAAQLQVISEYKARLEKSLAVEKSSNAVVKQELQQRASREKSLRDRDSIEAMQKFNSLQQTYKLLQTEHQDLQEECKKREKQALDETNRLEATLQDLRSRIRQEHEKDKSKENLKTLYLNMQTEKMKFEKLYNELLHKHENSDSTIMHLQKEIFQLKRELASANNQERKDFHYFSKIVPDLNFAPSTAQSELQKQGSQPIPAPQHQQQQVSSPQPLHAPHDNRADGAVLSEEKLNDDANEPPGDIRFVQRNGNIVPADANDLKEVGGEQRDPPQLVNDFQPKQQKNVVERPDVENVRPLGDGNGGKNDPDEEQNKQVIPPPNREDSSRNNDVPFTGAQAEEPAIEKASRTVALDRPLGIETHADGDDELQALQERVGGILNNNVQ